MIDFCNEELQSLYRQYHQELVDESQPIRDDGFTFEIKSSVIKEMRVRELKPYIGCCEYFIDYYINYEFITDAPKEYVDIMKSSVISKWGGHGRSCFWRHHGFDMYQGDPENMSFSAGLSGTDYDTNSIETYLYEKSYFDERIPDITL